MNKNIKSAVLALVFLFLTGCNTYNGNTPLVIRSSSSGLTDSHYDYTITLKELMDHKNNWILVLYEK